ncbi:MAG: NAD(P)H-dependent oxidoreductase [Rubritepida sp.]|jgi:putative NADPH-quinone reductase|nr:NAD(P)H-dependent oxidoreductase [Rubritepida sp.]MCU0944730.1 NAD(P)H-dependent oxidoreductase [Rubritepida sp.]
MRVLVLYSHPLPESFNAATHAAVLDGLRAAGHEVDDCDLYAEGFNPVLTAEERRNYHDPALNRLPVASYVERLQRAEALVLVYPTWCFSLPAMLKGWMDRVLLPGVSFNLVDGVARPALTHLTRIAGVVTYGRPRWNAIMVSDPPRKAVTRYLRMLNAGRARIEYHALYDMNRATQARREAFLAQLRERFARW